jgi:hypothetical protein
VWGLDGKWVTTAAMGLLLVSIDSFGLAGAA